MSRGCVRATVAYLYINEYIYIYTYAYCICICVIDMYVQYTDCIV